MRGKREGKETDDDVKRREVKENSLVLDHIFPECTISPRDEDVYVNRLYTPPVLLTPVLYSST